MAGRLMSKEEAQRVKDAIGKATSVEEIRRLERSLREGFMPTMDAIGA
jgi:U2 small nuclear ribonucleoprotein A'